MREQGDSSMSTLDLQLSLSDDVLVYLKREASKRQISLDVIISEVLAGYFNSPTKQEILDDLKLGMQQALTGRSRSAHDVLDMLNPV